MLPALVVIVITAVKLCQATVCQVIPCLSGVNIKVNPLDGVESRRQLPLHQRVLLDQQVVTTVLVTEQGTVEHCSFQIHWNIILLRMLSLDSLSFTPAASLWLQCPSCTHLCRFPVANIIRNGKEAMKRRIRELLCWSCRNSTSCNALLGNRLPTWSSPLWTALLQPSVRLNWP